MKCFNVATHSVGSSLEAQFFFVLVRSFGCFFLFSFAFVTWNKRRLNIVSLNAICQKCYVLRAKIMIKHKNTGPHSITVTITTFNFQMEYPHKLLCMARSERVSEWVSVRFAFVNVIYFCSVALILPTWANRQEELRKKWGKISCKQRENGDRRERKNQHTRFSLSHTFLRPSSAWHEKPKCTPRKIVSIITETYLKYKTFSHDDMMNSLMYVCCYNHNAQRQWS